MLWLFQTCRIADCGWSASALLCVAFVRLALNPAVLEYHKRTATPIWNWYLYAYGITSVCSARRRAALWSAAARTFVERIAPRVLYSLGAILAFLLLNIEIADYFSIGPTLTFSFSGNFARDMTLFDRLGALRFRALIVGMRTKAAGGALRRRGASRGYAGQTLPARSEQSDQLYRIGAFIGVALILIVASFIYQRFLAPSRLSAKSTLR